MKSRAVAVTALALPAIIVALVALVFMNRTDDVSGPCPEVDAALGEVAAGPRGWSAYARYEQWPEGGQCLGSLGVSFFAPGDNWEVEAWSPAAHVVVRSGLLPPPSRERAWLAWGDDGRPLLFGFGSAATPLLIDALPDVAEGPVVRRCPVVEGIRTDGAVDWSAVDAGRCVALPAELAAD